MSKSSSIAIPWPYYTDVSMLTIKVEVTLEIPFDS